MNKFLERQTTKHTQEKLLNLKSLIPTKKNEFVVKIPLPKKTSGQMSTKYLRNNASQFYINSSRKEKRKKYFSTLETGTKPATTKTTGKYCHQY